MLKTLVYLVQDKEIYDMNPLKRKMFMQQGGMVPQQMMAPPPQQMMAPPPQQMMPPAEMPMAPGPEEVMAEAQKQEGDELVSGILSQVDSAQDYEQLMNAIRGDEIPVEGRRDELAGLVGEPDAEQTPDSVLTLVQPTMAIVDAQGGLDSLMQGEADVVMEDEMGMPTDMAGGVGSMLMAGQPEEPVQMADGGMVRKMALGSTDSTNSTTNRYLAEMQNLEPLFAEIMGDPEARRKASLGQAQLGLAGDIVSNLFTPSQVPVSFMGRLAPAAGQFGKNLGKMGAEELAREEKTKLGQLQMAGAEITRQKEAEAALALARQKNIDAQNQIKLEARLEKENRTFTLKPGDKIVDGDNNIIAQGEGKRHVLKEGDKLVDGDNNVIAQGFSEKGRTLNERDRNILFDRKRVDEYISGADTQSANEYEELLIQRAKGVIYDTQGRLIEGSELPLSNYLIGVIKKRYPNQKDLPTYFPGDKIIYSESDKKTGPDEKTDPNKKTGPDETVIDTATPVLDQIDETYKNQYTPGAFKDFDPKELGGGLLATALRNAGTTAEKVFGTSDEFFQENEAVYKSVVNDFVITLRSNLNAIDSSLPEDDQGRTLVAEVRDTISKVQEDLASEGIKMGFNAKDAGRKIEKGIVASLSRAINQIKNRAGGSPELLQRLVPLTDITVELGAFSKFLQEGFATGSVDLKREKAIFKKYKGK